mgnify:CR=1 FL=1
MIVFQNRILTKGISAVWNPIGDVSFASESIAPTAYKVSRARIIASGGGDDNQSKRMMLSIPNAFS